MRRRGRRAAKSMCRVIYRFAWVRSVRMMLRAKVLQLGGGLGLAAPVLAAAEGNPLGMGDTAVLAAVAGGTLVVGNCLSWCASRRRGRAPGSAPTLRRRYCERFAMQISWREPAVGEEREARPLRVSTLTMWGNRRDTDYSLADVSRTLGAHEELAPSAGRRAQPYVPLRVGGLTYVLMNSPTNIREPHAVNQLLRGRPLFPGEGAAVDRKHE